MPTCLCLFLCTVSSRHRNSPAYEVHLSVKFEWPSCAGRFSRDEWIDWVAEEKNGDSRRTLKVQFTSSSFTHPCVISNPFAGEIEESSCSYFSYNDSQWWPHLPRFKRDKKHYRNPSFHKYEWTNEYISILVWTIPLNISLSISMQPSVLWRQLFSSVLFPHLEPGGDMLIGLCSHANGGCIWIIYIIFYLCMGKQLDLCDLAGSVWD